MNQVAVNPATAGYLRVWRFPLRMMGLPLGRTVTAIRLGHGEVILHSTAPFTAEALQNIRQFGEPACLLEATLMHDTYARAARSALPHLPYFAPPGFFQRAGVTTQPISALPMQWREEIEWLELAGMPAVREHAFLHRPSRTLIVPDLVFNFGQQHSRLTKILFRWGAGIRTYPGLSRLFRILVRDRSAFTHSLHTILGWDFDQLIVGHGDILETRGKEHLSNALARAGFPMNNPGAQTPTSAK